MRSAELDFQQLSACKGWKRSFCLLYMIWINSLNFHDSIIQPETPNRFIAIQRHFSQRMGEGLSKDTIFSHGFPFRPTFIRLIAFSLIACYDIVHQDREAFPVLLTSSSSSESSPSGWSSSSSLLSVSLISGRL